MNTSTSDTIASFPKLGEDNYSSWCKNMKAYLMQKKVWAIVKGTDVKPSPGDSDLRDWLKDEQLAAGVIYLGLEEGQKSQVEDFLDDPKHMWEALEAIHVQKRPSTRFNAYNSLLSISKQENESLPSLTARVEKAMQEVKNLRPTGFLITDLDEDLMCMAMVRSLPSEYRSFVSSLILLPQFDFKTLKEAFLLEEDNRKNSEMSTGISAAANLANTSKKQPNASKTTPPSSSSSPKLVCEFCQAHYHSQAQCHMYKLFQAQARLQAIENRSNRRNTRPNASNTSSSLPSASRTAPGTTTSSEHASVAQNSGNVEEFAGNASTTLPDSHLPQFSHSTCWCADTGASSHMTPHKSWFETYEPYAVPVRVANGTVVNSAGIGSVRFKPALQGVRSREVVFHRVLHVPQLQNNLLSVLYLTSKQGFRVVIDNQSMRFERQGVLLFTATLKGKLAYLDGTTLRPQAALSTLSTSILPLSLDLWHRRFAHISIASLKRILSSNVVSGLQIDSTAAPDPICEPCIAGKQHRIINTTSTRSKQPLAIVHCDLHGPMPVQSIQGHKYFIVFVDDATRLWCLYFLKSKGEAAQAFYAFKAEIEKQTGRQIKCLHDDKEGGLSSNEFNSKLSNWGIIRRFTMRAEPHSNGVAERAIRSIADTATSMLYESHLPSSFWSKAVSTAVYLHNRLPTAANDGLTPFELMYGRKPDVSLFRVFGSLAYVHIKKDKRSGFSPHMQKAIFVGYPAQYKGWEFYNPSTKRLVLSDRADFDERVFPGLATRIPEPPAFPTPPASSLPPPLVPTAPDDDRMHREHREMHHQVGDDVGGDDTSSSSSSSSNSSSSHSGHSPLLQAPSPARDHSPSMSTRSDTPPDAPAPPLLPQQPSVRRSGRAKVPASQWKQNWFKANYKPSQLRVAPQPPPAHQYRDPAPQIPPSSDEDEPSSQSESDSEESEESELVASEFAYLTIPEALEVAYKSAARSDGPRSYAQAMALPDAQKYHEAACDEIQSLLDNGTWELAQLPPGRKAVGCRWVFVIKRKADGTVDRFKARLVAQGFSQRPGFDFQETYASTLKWATLRAILAYAAIEDLEIESVDISSAFLNGEIDSEVFMRQPEGFPQGSPEQVLRLKKSIYGLRQSPRLWHQKLNSVLLSLRFKKIKSDASVWVFDRDGVRVIVPVFVDDMTLVSKSKQKITELKEELKKHFKLRDLGPTDFLLGVKIDRDRSHRILQLSQRQYTLDVLARYGFDSCSPVSTPLNPGVKLSLDQCPKSPEEAESMRSVPYSHAVGSLMYLAISTRPDIAYAVGVLARYSSNPGQAHWAAVKHLFRYLQGTLDYKLTYTPDPSSPSLFTTFSDADHGGCKDSGRSTGAYVVKMGTGAVSWSSKLQSIVAMSTTEAEYVAAVSAGAEICWLRNLFSELGIDLSFSPSPLHIDNQSALAVAKNPEHHGRMKHLDLRFYWLRDEVDKKTISLSYCPTESMPADLLTKALPLVKVQACCKMLGLGV